MVTAQSNTKRNEMEERNREKKTEVGRGVELVKPRGAAQVTGPLSPILQRKSRRSQAASWPCLAPSHSFCMAPANETLTSGSTDCMVITSELGPAPCHSTLRTKRNLFQSHWQEKVLSLMRAKAWGQAAGDPHQRQERGSRQEGLQRGWPEHKKMVATEETT